MPDRGTALFDLDHTILPFDTQVLFANFVLQRERWRRVLILPWLLLAPLAVVGVLGASSMKRAFFSLFTGMREDRLRAYADDFARSVFLDACYPEMRREIQRNREQGRRLILNSASPEFYLIPIAAGLGFDECVGTRLDIAGRVRFFPRIDGSNNKGAEKIGAMRDRGIIPRDTTVLANSVAYSDSSSDLPLLRIASNAVVVHPGRRLEKEAERAGWRTVRPDRPYGGKWGGRWATARQAIGCWARGE